MNRITGLAEIFVFVISMVVGAAFLFVVFELGNAARPGEMKVWGSAESTPASTAGPSAPVIITTTPEASATSAVPAEVAAGKAVFEKSCSGCHPGRAQGVGPALDAAGLKQKYPQDSDLAKKIRSGGGIMPPFGAGQLSENDLQALIAYLRSGNA